MSLFVDHLVAGGVAAVVVWILCQIGPVRRRPALCHALWGLLLVRLIAPPLAQIPILLIAPSRPEVAYEFPANALREHAPAATGTPNVSVEPPGTDARKDSTTPTQTLPTAGDHHHKLNKSPADRLSRPTPVSVLPLLLGGSLCVTAVLWMNALRQILKVRRLLRGMSDTTDRAIQALHKTAAQFHLRRTPKLLVVDSAVAPMLWAGGQRAAIILPRQLVQSIRDDQLDQVIAHELAHWIRRDHWTSLLAQAIVSVVWWNPIAWIARRQMLTMAEVSCDAMAIERLGHRRKSYATTLLQVIDFIDQSSPALAVPGTAFGSSQQLFKRFHSLSDARVKPSISAVGRLVLVLGAASLVVLPVRSQESPTPNSIAGIDAEVAGDLVVILGGDAGRVSGLPLTLVTDPTGKLVYLPETDGTVSVYDTDSLRCLQRLPLHSERCLDLAIIDDGKQLVSISIDGNARLWDISGPDVVRLDEFSITDKPDFVKMSSATHRALFAFRSSEAIRFVEIREGKFAERAQLRRDEFVGPTGIPHDFVFSPDGSWFVTCELESTSTFIAVEGAKNKYVYYDASLVLWNLVDGKPERHFELKRKTVSNLNFSTDSKHLYGDDPHFLSERKTHHWQIENGELIPQADLEHGSGRPFGKSVLFSQDGRLSAQISDQEMSIFAAGEKGLVSRGVISFKQRIFSSVFVGDDVLLVAENLLQRWDWKDGQYRQRKLPAGHHSTVNGLFFDARNNSLISTSTESALEWNLKKLVKGTPVPYETLSLGSVHKLSAKADHTEFLVLQDLDGEQFVTGIGSTAIGELTEKFSIEMTKGSEFEQCWCMAIHPTERLVATGHHNNKIFLWNVEGDQPTILASWRAHAGHVCALAFSPDGNQLASVGWDHATFLWDLDHNNGRDGAVPQKKQAGMHDVIVRSVAWSKDGKYLASGAEDGVILLWEIENGNPLGSRSLVDPQDDPSAKNPYNPKTISSLEFSQSGQHLLSADGKGRVSIWSVDTAEQLKKWTLPGWVWNARYSPDESTIAIANNNGSIYLVRTKPDER